MLELTLQPTLEEVQELIAAAIVKATNMITKIFFILKFFFVIK